MFRHIFLLILAGAIVVACASEPDQHLATVAQAATVPTGFTDEILVTGLASPTQFEFSPDGRLFVCQQGGALRVVKNGTLLATPAIQLNVNSTGERGLLGIAFDPDSPRPSTCISTTPRHLPPFTIG